MQFSILFWMLNVMHIYYIYIMCLCFMIVLAYKQDFCNTWDYITKEINITLTLFQLPVIQILFHYLKSKRTIYWLQFCYLVLFELHSYHWHFFVFIQLSFCNQILQNDTPYRKNDAIFPSDLYSVYNNHLGKQKKQHHINLRLPVILNTLQFSLNLADMNKIKKKDIYLLLGLK